ncbi:MAG: YhbY family RNA-binding protein [Oscillospiraceae bacterium]|nr:YhbY family RNA-binding protein [Oscillospiraceae bacterium]
MLTSKQRAELRSKANTLDTKLIVGKGGVTENVVAEANVLLESFELVKGKVLETAMLSPREACDAICEATGADGVQIVGTKFVFYRKSEKLEQARKAAEAAEKKKKTNPVRAGVQARRRRAKAEREQRNRFFREQAANERRDRREKDGE